MYEYNYYIQEGEDLVAYDYHELYYAVASGRVAPDTKVIQYEPLFRDKKYIKAKDILK